MAFLHQFKWYRRRCGGCWRLIVRDERHLRGSLYSRWLRVNVGDPHLLRGEVAEEERYGAAAAIAAPSRPAAQSFDVSSIDTVWKTGWRQRLCKDGKIVMKELKQVLYDYTQLQLVASQVYVRVTGGAVHDTGASLEAILPHIDYHDRWVLRQVEEEAAAARYQARWDRRLLRWLRGI